MNTVRRRDERHAAPLATVHAARVTAPGQVEVVATPAPAPAAGQAQLRPELVTLCGSDLRTVYSGGADAYPLPPGVSGHEIVARVTAPDPAAAAPDGLAPGTRVLALVTQQQGNGRAFRHPLLGPDPVAGRPAGRAPGAGAAARHRGVRLPAGRQRGRQECGGDRAGQRRAAVRGDAAPSRRGPDPGAGPERRPYRPPGCAWGPTRRTSPSATTRWPAWPRSPAAPWPTWWWRLPAPRTPSTWHRGWPAPVAASCSSVCPSRTSSRSTSTPCSVPSAASLSVSGAAAEPGRRSFRLALDLIVRGAIEVAGLVSHVFLLQEVARAYELARSRADGALKVGVRFDGA